MSFYAHSLKDESKADWQLLNDHLNAVGDMAAEFAGAFNASSLGHVLGVLHDLGKYTLEFQKRLEGGPRVDHATWGARTVIDYYPQLGQLLAYAIAGHHTGLVDGQIGEKQKHTNLTDRLIADLPELVDDWKEELSLPSSDKLKLPDGLKPSPKRGMFQLAFLTRMLFSCLVDADYIDTNNYYRRMEDRPPRNQSDIPTLPQLRDKLNIKLAGFKPDSKLNRLRLKILNHVREQASHEPGLFSLTVPTGGGKTLTSLAFALDHAIKHGLKRIIYVIPFTSIIEQNAKVFRDAFEELGESAVLEHHSAFTDDPENSPEAKEKRYLVMENWDAPIIVTTAVQFFESLFSNRPSSCRKLHNIANSVVILDEAQTLPLKLLYPCVVAIDELALNYKTSIILCTATQPALRVEQGFNDGLENVHELAPDPSSLYVELRRVSVRHVGQLSDEAIAERLLQRNQALCIVNNRRHARALYEKIAGEGGVYHLSTLMYARHRRKILSQVRKDLRDNKPCRLISTSLIEAGVDIDFPFVMRAEAGLDSIAQAAGRCNREGKQSFEDSEVLVFSVCNKDWKPPAELEQYSQVFRSIARNHIEDLLALDALNDYFQELYWQKGDKELDAKGLLGLLRSSSVDNLPLETLARKFRIIESVMYPIIIPFIPGSIQKVPELEKIFNIQEFALNLKQEFALNLARLFQSYLVQVPERAYKALYKSGAIQPLAKERYGEQFMYLVNHDLYNDKTGLSWDEPEFITAENLVH